MSLEFNGILSLNRDLEASQNDINLSYLRSRLIDDFSSSLMSGKPEHFHQVLSRYLAVLEEPALSSSAKLLVICQILKFDGGHQRLSDPEFMHLNRLADDLLDDQVLKESVESIKVMEEYFLERSRIASRHGDVWWAHWYAMKAHKLLDRPGLLHEADHYLVVGHSLLGVKKPFEAMNAFLIGIEFVENPKDRLAFDLGVIRALKLQGQAQAAIDRLKAMDEVPEVLWERATFRQLQMAPQKQFKRFRSLIKGLPVRYEYHLLLWAYLVNYRGRFGQLPSPKDISYEKLKAPDAKAFGALHEFLVFLHKALEGSIDRSWAGREMVRLLSEKDKIPCPELKQLFQLVLMKWLGNYGLEYGAGIASTDYRRDCLAYSNQKNSDLLAVLDNFDQIGRRRRQWFRRFY